MDKPIRLLITHQNPDEDAIAACWLFMGFGGQPFTSAELYFVPAGETISDETLRAKGVDRDETVHVDTGMGPYDHHQPDNTLHDSATERVYNYLASGNPAIKEDKALKRMVAVITDIDHFGNCWWPEAANDRYNFMLEELLRGLRGARSFTDHELVNFGIICLDGIYNRFKSIIKAEQDIVSLGRDFKCKWGKALMIENKNEEVMKIAMKSGYMLVVRRDPETRFMRLKAVPERGIDLKPVYDQLVAIDQTGTWYFHPSRAMVLNGSEHNPNHVPTPLSLEQVVEIIKNI